jgi:hypothetical protein
LSIDSSEVIPKAAVDENCHRHRLLLQQWQCGCALTPSFRCQLLQRDGLRDKQSALLHVIELKPSIVDVVRCGLVIKPSEAKSAKQEQLSAMR